MDALSVDREERRIVVRIGGRRSLYGPTAEAMLAELTAVAERMHQPSPPECGVLVLQESPLNDADDALLRDLTETCLLDDVARAFDDLRWLLFLIRHSPVPWTFASAHDCLGSAFELALSCHKRLWFAPEARLGFPAIAAGFYPPGGIIEALNKRAGKTRDAWAAKPQLTAHDACVDGMINFCSRADDWRAAATEFFDLVHEERERTGRQAPNRAPRIDFSTPRDAEARQTAFETLDFLATSVKASPVQPKTAWEICWELVKERAKLKDPRDLGRLIAYVAARHALSPQFVAWTAQQRYQRRARPAALVNARPSARVVIDLDYLAPPVDIISRILKAETQITFVGSEPEALAVAVNLVYNRLERAIGAEPAASVWDRLVSWYQGDVATPHVRWTIDDRMVVATAEAEVSFLRLAGNSSGAEAGYLEWTAPTPESVLPDEILSVVRLVCDGVMTSPARAVPRSVHVRSLFFEELVRIARYVEGDLAAVVEGLNLRGWGFAGSDDAWDRFLNTRRDAYRLDTALAGFGAPQLDRANWELGGFKHARTLAKKGPALTATDMSAGRWNPTGISQHMAMFLGLVVDQVSKDGARRSDADGFCALALGFPASLGAPGVFLRRHGRRRVENYAARHWPNFRFDHAWGDHDDT